MGYYINELPNGTPLQALGKADALLTIEGAEEISQPSEWKEGIVCVVNNGFFEGAGYCFSTDELKAFSYPDGRPKRWLIIPNAKQLAK